MLSTLHSLRITTLILAAAAVGCGQGSGSPAAASEGTEPSAPAATTGQEQPAPADGTGATPPAPPTAATPVQAALAGAHRSPENRARDAYRHPEETLAFFGLEPGMKVVELSPGGGWYTEVLAPVVCAEGGSLRATIPDPEGESAKYAKLFQDRLAKDPGVFTCVEPVVIEPKAGQPAPPLAPPGTMDMVLTFRSTHGWINRGQAELVYKAAFEALKPGGTLGVVQHRAPEGSDPKVTAKQGYVPEAYVIELAKAAGFTLVGSSDINRNPKDTHDHPEGVWTLPPVLRLEDTDRDKYLGIGESDRMTLKFQKPAS